jgi:hypothetical protein
MKTTDIHIHVALRDMGVGTWHFDLVTYVLSVEQVDYNWL